MDIVSRKQLQIKMLGFGDTNDTLAQALNMHAHTLYMKMKPFSKQEFTLSEIKTIVNRYNLTPDEIYTIFIKS